MRKVLFGLGVVSLSVVALSACSDEDNNPADDEGTLTVFVADAPVDFATQVQVQFVGAEAVRSDGTVDSVDFSDSPIAVDLLATATGDAVRVLDSEEFDEGNYDEIRLLIDTANADANFVETDADNDGTTERYPLTVVDSQIGSSQGFAVSEVGGDSLLLEVDLRRSLSGDAADGGFTLNPVVTQSDPDDVADLEGTVATDGVSDLFCEDEEAKVAVYVYDGSTESPGDVDGGEGEAEPVASGIVAADGSYVVKRLPSGPYSAAFTCQAGLDQPGSNDPVLFSDIQSITLSAGETGNLSF